MPRPSNVGVGVSVMIVAGGERVLLGLRKGAHGAGTWSFPGGWIDRTDRSIDDAARREVLEETGIDLNEIEDASSIERLCETTADYPSYGFRTVTLFRIVEVPEPLPVVVHEPDKCEQWRWFHFEEIPWKTLFDGVEEALWMSPQTSTWMRSGTFTRSWLSQKRP